MSCVQAQNVEKGMDLCVLLLAVASWQIHSLISPSLRSAAASAVLADAWGLTRMAGLACVSQSRSRDSCCGSISSPGGLCVSSNLVEGCTCSNPKRLVCF